MSKFDQNQIEKGIEIEKEHKDTIEKIIEDARKDKVEPLSEYYKGISLDHLNEEPLYYVAPDGTDRLKKLEEEAREDLKNK